MAAIDPSLILQALQVLILPALWFVIRIDRRVGQMDVLQSRDGRQLVQLERAMQDLNHRLIRLECK